MKAFITSIGETTTELCKWSLERNGYDVEVISGGNSLAEKLMEIYSKVDTDFVRVDADVIVNKQFRPELLVLDTSVWWWQFVCFDWLKVDISHGGINFIKREALPYLRLHAAEFVRMERPETELYRIKEFYEPRRCMTYDKAIMGVHGFGQSHYKRVIETKQRRNQISNYDFELMERLNQL